MANNNLESYLEAILETVRGGKAGDVPTPSWNYERYLAAILNELKNGSGSQRDASTFAAMSNNAATEAVDGGTKILNKTAFAKLCAQAGFYYLKEGDPEYAENANWPLSVYAVMNLPAGYAKYALFTLSDSKISPQELKLDTATAIARTYYGSARVYSHRGNTPLNVQRPIVNVRFCAVAYDENNNEAEVVYSAQYQYVYGSNGTVTRIRFATQPTEYDHIIDLGLMKNSVRLAETQGDKTPNAFSYPFEGLVSTPQPIGWEHVVNNSIFDDAPYGYSIAAMNGYGDIYRGATVHKGNSLPAVTAQDDGAELLVKNGSWAKQQKRCVVALTPTAQDLSGTMDKTVAEINAAHEAGQEIWFAITVAGMGSYYARCSEVGAAEDSDYPSFNALAATHLGLVQICTGTTNDGSREEYFVRTIVASE